MKLQGKRGGSDFRFGFFLFFCWVFFPLKEIESLFQPAVSTEGCFCCLVLFLLFVTKQHQRKESFGTSLIASKQLPCHSCTSQHQKFALNFRSSCGRLRLLNNNIIIKNNSTSSSTSEWKSGQRCPDVQSFILQKLPPYFCTNFRFWRAFSHALFISQVAKISWSLLSFWASADSSERAETVWKDPENWFTPSWVQIEHSSAKH